MSGKVLDSHNFFVILKFKLPLSKTLLVRAILFKGTVKSDPPSCLKGL